VCREQRYEGGGDVVYVGQSDVEIGAWAAIGGDSEIRYVVLRDADTIEFTIGGRHGLDLDMSEAGLRRCTTAFNAALAELDAAETDNTDDADENYSSYDVAETSPGEGR
jgi:hypothetical protein